MFPTFFCKSCWNLVGSPCIYLVKFYALFDIDSIFNDFTFLKSADTLAFDNIFSDIALNTRCDRPCVNSYSRGKKNCLLSSSFLPADHFKIRNWYKWNFLKTPSSVQNGKFARILSRSWENLCDRLCLNRYSNFKEI